MWPKVENGRVEQPDPENPFVWKLYIYGPVRVAGERPARPRPRTPTRVRRGRLLAPQELYSVASSVRPCPYAGREFCVTIKYPKEYPFKAPEMRFATGVLYHPNVNNATGEMCMEGIDAPAFKITDRAAHVLKFLATPNVESPQDADCAALMTRDIEAYEKKAREWAAKAPAAPKK
jgi:ubiquitin-protein ligase